MSISWIDSATSASSASLTGPCSPAMVNTLRLWDASEVRSSSDTPATPATAAASRSTTSMRRPSDTFGTLSTSTGRC